MSLLPQSGKVELHLVANCDLQCQGCTRASWLRDPVHEALTLDDIHELFRQCDELRWYPRVTIVGGEPTLSPIFEEAVRVATEWCVRRRRDWAVQVFSNQFTPKSRALLTKVNQRYLASICDDTAKLDGSIMVDSPGRDWRDDMYVSPTDLGMPLRAPCWMHSSQICGVSVDHDGYSPCAPGGAIDSLLKVGGRTKVLADLFDPEKMAAMTAALCGHCGFGLISPEQKADLPKHFGVPMSPRWVEAFRGRK